MSDLDDDAVRERIRQLAPWFHRVDLGGGRVTKTASVSGEDVDHPLATWKLVRKALPDDFGGRSVLDVGCNAGFYSFEAKRRGAGRVLGVDAQRHQIRQALFCRRMLGLDVEFRRLSVYDLGSTTTGSFDYVLALGLIYHLKHLILALERLYDVTKERLVVETAVLPPDIVPDVPFDLSVGGEGLAHHPIAYVENRSDAKEAVYNWFLPSPEAVRAMLADVGFEDVEIVAVRNDRAVLAGVRPAKSSISVLSQLAASTRWKSGADSWLANDPYRFEIDVENTGRVPIDGDRVRVAAHLLRDDEDVEWEWTSAPLGADLAPGERRHIPLLAVPPETPDRYVIEVDLVLERLAWFEDLGSPLLRQPLVVTAGGSGGPWYRRAGLEAALPSPPAGELIDAVEAAVRRDGLPTWLPRLAQSLQGYPFPASTLEDFRRHPRELRRTLRWLLLAPETKPLPHPLPASSISRLAEAVGWMGSTGATASGESFPGEAAIARALLERGREMDDAAFVTDAYQFILGRPPDPAGLQAALVRLEHDSTRAFLLRDLLWSDELRGRWPNA